MTRKDKLCLNVLRMQEKFGRKAFNIVPETFVLPDEFADFFSFFHKEKNKDSRKPLWIVKPSA